MSFTLHGIAVSGGIAIGRAHRITHATREVSHYLVEPDRIETEIARFDSAVKATQDELKTLHKDLNQQSPAELGAFLDLHWMILSDATLSQTPRQLIRDTRCNAEWALVQQMDALVAQFNEIEDAYLRERKQDVVQVVERVLKVMMAAKLATTDAMPALDSKGKPKRNTQEGEMIVVAHDLSPADMLIFKDHSFAGFVTDVGGATAHTAIMARSLALPAIVGIKNAHALVTEGEWLIIDGTAGVLIVAPNEHILEEYRLKAREVALKREKLKRLKTAPAVTLDGREVSLQANIELPDDVASALDAGAQGVGLFRTEFLFMNRTEMPAEDEQFEAYASVVRAMEGRTVTIRTLDVGADKLDFAGGKVMEHMRSQANPALGLRAIRYSLAEPQLFMAQLRAILRASALGPVKILLPMVAHAHEIDLALSYIAQARKQLAARELAFDQSIKVGGMIEVPAAALSLGLFIRKLDYLSIGTNDLIQYTLAIDRTDEEVAHLYDPLHPAVLQLLAQTIGMANRAHVEVAVCGEMAGDPLYARLFIGMGLQQFSMHSAQLLEVKQAVLQSNYERSNALVARMLHADEPDAIRATLEELNG